MSDAMTELREAINRLEEHIVRAHPRVTRTFLEARARHAGRGVEQGG